MSICIIKYLNAFKSLAVHYLTWVEAVPALRMQNAEMMALIK